MGNLQIQPLAPIVLVPPLMEGRRSPRKKLTQTPFEYLFCEKELRQLFENYIPTLGGFRFSMSMQPEEFTGTTSPEDTVTVQARVALPSSDNITGASGSAAFQWENIPLNESDVLKWADARVHIRNDRQEADTSFRARFGCFHPPSGAGAFATADSAQVPSVGIRYSSQLTSCGLKISDGIPNPILTRPPDAPKPSAGRTSIPANLWAVQKNGRLVAGIECITDLYKGILADYQIGLSYTRSSPAAQDNSFVASIQLRNQLQSIVASYYHHLVVRRAVRNPLAPAHVKDITNYIDIGFQIVGDLRRPGSRQVNEDANGNDGGRGSKGPSAKAGISWQVNKNWMVKAAIDGSDVVGAIVGRTWWTPRVTGCVSCRYDMRSHNPVWGFDLSLENFGEAVYQKAIAPSETPTKWEPGMTERQERAAFRAQQMPQNKTEVIEPHPAHPTTPTTTTTTTKPAQSLPNFL